VYGARIKESRMFYILVTLCPGHTIGVIRTSVLRVIIKIIIIDYAILYVVCYLI
jgi:hypothetical protein